MTTTTNERIYSIDGLRFLAAVAVMLFHFTIIAQKPGLELIAPGELPAIGKWGFFGVELFFAISGFVILWSVWDKSPSDFVRSRILRLYPAYWLAVTLTSLVLLAGGLWAAPSLGEYIANMTMLHGFLGINHIDGVYWTLTVELVFYGWILLWMITGRRHLPLLLLAWLLIAGVLRKTHFEHPVTNLLLLKDWAAWFIAGCSAFMIFRRIHLLKACLLYAACLPVALHSALERAHEYGQRFPYDYAQTTAAGIVLSIFSIMLAIAITRGRLLNLPFLKWAGALTYPLYLVHEMIGFTLFKLLRPELHIAVILPLVCALMLTLAWVLHKFGEQPLQRWLKRKLDQKVTLGPRETVSS